jgi:hypothetical protein
VVWIAIPLAHRRDHGTRADELGNRALEVEVASPWHAMQPASNRLSTSLNEAGWRIELRAALQAGDTEGFHTVPDDL